MIGIQVRSEPRPKSFFYENRKSLVSLIYGLKALREGINQNGNVIISKQKYWTGKKSERILQHQRSVDQRKSQDHRFRACEACNIKFFRATSGTSGSLWYDATLLTTTCDFYPCILRRQSLHWISPAIASKAKGRNIWRIYYETIRWVSFYLSFYDFSSWMKILTTLDLSNTSFEDDMAKHIADALKQNTVNIFRYYDEERASQYKTLATY